MNTPLPIRPIREVTQVVVHDETTATDTDHKGRTVLICPDEASGHRGRYSVITINWRSGKCHQIGRELPLRLARKVARAG